MEHKLGIDQDVVEYVADIEDKLSLVYKEIDDIGNYNSAKVLEAFISNNLGEVHFNQTTGYGYNDIGRDVIENIYSSIFKSEDSLVRGQFISGTHALSVCLFACLRPGDIMLSITGRPYDTLQPVIGIIDNPSSLKSFGVMYDEIDLIDNDFDYDKIRDYLLNNKVKLIEIQRSRGYSTRKSIDIDKLEKVIKFIKDIDKNIIIMIDNCYCEFVCKKEPVEVGADIVVGSLIKNLGSGIALNGGYITGRADLIRLCAERLNVAAEGKDVGPSLGMNRSILQGLYFAPSVVASAMKTSVLTSYVLSDMGYDVEPKYDEKKADIVLSITFNDSDVLIKYCQAIQSSLPIDANVLPVPSDMPGYSDQIIMACGSFVQGSSIELSCDGPIRPPYIAYQQGGIMYSYGRISVMKVISALNKFNSGD